MLIDEGLKQFATETQSKYIDAANQYGSHRKAAVALNVNPSSVDRAIVAVKRKAAIQGYSPQHDMTKTVPEPLIVRGVSTCYNSDGQVTQQWVKTRLDDDMREAMVREVIATMSSEVRPFQLITPPKRTIDELLNVIPIGDPHHGLYAWALESGDDFDNDIARQLTLGAVDRLMASAPDAETCIILPLGDVFHANDQSNVTPGHKHQLDVDSRFVKVLGIGIETYRHAVIRALQKHSRVIVRFVPGNHDPQAIWALAFTIQAFFADNPRVTVDLSPSKFWFYKFGKVLLGATHGDTVKHEGLPGVMACDRAEDWGQTKHRYWYTGHVHNQTVKEFPGVICESFRTLAAKDAYAAGHGYRAGRDMVCITHHKEYGEVERHRCDIAMLKEAA